MAPIDDLPPPPQAQPEQNQLNSAASPSPIDDLPPPPGYKTRNEPDMGPMKSYIAENLSNYQKAKNVPRSAGDGETPGPAPVPSDASASNPPNPDSHHAHQANGLLESVEAGFQMTTAGLIARGKMPDTVLPEDASFAMRIAYQASTLAGDIPAMLAGGLIGSAAGAAAGSAVAPGPGTIAGTAIGADAGAWAAPAALRHVLIDHYQKGNIHTFQDFWERASGAFIDALKQGTVGAVTGGVGNAVEGTVAKAAIPALTKTAATSAAELATMTTLGKAMDGKMPNAQDFIDGAVLLGGFHAVGSAVDATNAKIKLPEAVDGIKEKLQNIYAKTGLQPSQVAEDAQKNPALKQELLSTDKQLPSQYKGMAEPPQPGQETLVKGDPEFQNAHPDAADLHPTLSKDFSSEDHNLQVEKSEETEGAKPDTESGTESGTKDEGRSDAEKAVLERIVPSDANKKSPTFDELKSKLYTDYFDDLHPVKQLVDTLNGDKPDLKGASDPYTLLRTGRGSFGRAEQFLQHAPYDFNTAENIKGVKSFKDAIDPVKDDLDGLRAYMVSKRALDLHDRGIETGINPDDARQVVDQGEKKFGQAQQDLVAYRNSLLKYTRDSGLISEEAYQKMIADGENYVPLYRLMDEGGGGPKASKGVTSPVKRIEGSDRQIVDPIESMIKDTFTMVQMAERNRALTTLADLAESAGEEGKGAPGLMEKKPASMQRIEITPEVKDFLHENGMDPDLAEDMSVFRAKSQPLAKDEVALFREGKREVWSVDPEVAKAISGLDQGQTNILMKLLKAPAAALRAGAVMTPDFAVRHGIRDTLNTAINSKNGSLPFVTLFQGLGELMRKGDGYQEWFKSGGANSAMASIDRDYIQNNIFKLSQETGLIDKAQNVIKHPIEALRALTELASNASRLGEFMNARKNGEDIFSAGLASRDVTLDFARTGAKTKALNSIVAFWNARIQGADKLARSMIDNPLGTTAKLTAMITTPSVLLWWANKDDQRVQDLPRWEKDLFWIVATKDHLYRIPKPFEPGVLFGSLPERILDYYFGDNPEAFKGFQDSVIGEAIPSFLPTAVVPVAEQFANRSTMSGGRIVPAQLEKLLPEEQYTEYTSETAKQLSKIVGAVPGVRDIGFPGGLKVSSPAVIDNYIREWSGNTGKYVTQLIDKGLHAAGVGSAPANPPTDTLSDIPFVKAFVVRYPSASSQAIQDFYDHYDKSSQYIATIQHLAKTGDFQGAQHLMALQDSQENLLKLDGIKQGIGRVSQAIMNVNKDPSMTPNDKRQLIDSLYYQMINMAHMGNATVQTLHDQVKSKTQ